MRHCRIGEVLYICSQQTKNNDHGKQKNIFRKGNDAKYRWHNLIAHRRIAYVNDVDLHSRRPRLGMARVRAQQLQQIRKSPVTLFVCF